MTPEDIRIRDQGQTGASTAIAAAMALEMAMTQQSKPDPFLYASLSMSTNDDVIYDDPEYYFVRWEQRSGYLIAREFFPGPVRESCLNPIWGDCSGPYTKAMAQSLVEKGQIR